MYLILAIKKRFIVLVLLCGFNIYAQEESTNTDIKKTSKAQSEISKNERQKLFAFSLGYQNPIATGDNFIGEGLNGKSGFDIRLKAYVYKQFFVEYILTSSQFDVKNQALLGNYSETDIYSNNLLLGYEFLPIDKFRLGVSVSVLGKSRLSNSGFLNAETTRQNDTGKISTYGLYVSYDIARHLSLYIDYSYRSIKTNIAVPTAIQTFFEKGTYQTIGIGISASIGNRDVISRF